MKHYIVTIVVGCAVGIPVVAVLLALLLYVWYGNRRSSDYDINDTLLIDNSNAIAVSKDIEKLGSHNVRFKEVVSSETDTDSIGNKYNSAPSSLSSSSTRPSSTSASTPTINYPDDETTSRITSVYDVYFDKTKSRYIPISIGMDGAKNMTPIMNKGGLYLNNNNNNMRRPVQAHIHNNTNNYQNVALQYNNNNNNNMYKYNNNNNTLPQEVSTRLQQNYSKNSIKRSKTQRLNRLQKINKNNSITAHTSTLLTNNKDNLPWKVQNENQLRMQLGTSDNYNIFL